MKNQEEQESINIDELKVIEELKKFEIKVFSINSDKEYIILKNIYEMEELKPPQLSLQEQIREYTFAKPWFLNNRQNCSIKADYGRWNNKDCEDFKEDNCKVACRKGGKGSKKTLCVRKNL